MKKWLLPLLSCFLFACTTSTSTSSTVADPHQKNLLLHLAFDEGSGKTLHDQTKRQENVDIGYVLSDSKTLKTAQDPVWSTYGAINKALLFDGYSMWAEYNSVRIQGQQFSVSTWVAPRAYEWDDVFAKEENKANLTGIVSQYYRDEGFSAGVLLGYHREGKVSFQVGTGENWYELWDDGYALTKYQWNHVAATFDGQKGEMSLYINGKIVNQKEIPVGSAILYPDVPLFIGKNNVSRSSGSCTQGVLSGMLDDTKLYSSRLNYKDVIDYYYGNTLDGKATVIPFDEIYLQQVLKEDAHKTQAHGGPYQHWMNEPHAPIYYRGIYHLFFQFNPLGPYFNGAAGIAWGHLVSEDMVNWRMVKEAIVPTAGTVCPDGVWSGGSTYGTVKGVEDVPVLLFTAGNYRHPGLISNQNIGLATPKDPSDPYLIEWEISDELAIAQTNETGAAGEFRDAHVWIEGDTYYLLVGSRLKNAARGAVLLYTTSKTIQDPFHHWTYRGVLYDYPNQSTAYGSTWELPVMLPLTDAEGNPTDQYALLISPAPATTADNNIIYWTGKFNKTNYRFEPNWQGDARRMDYGKNVFTGPSGFIDPVSQKRLIFSIMQDQRESGQLASSGWANCVGFPREIFLQKDFDLGIRSLSSIQDYVTPTVKKQNGSVNEVNNAIQSFSSDMLAIKATFQQLPSSGKFGVRIRMNPEKTEYTEIYYDAQAKAVYASNALHTGNNAFSSGTFGGPLKQADEITMEIYLDRSLVESYFNQEKTISIRCYPGDLDATRVEIFSEHAGIVVSSFELSILHSIY